MPDHESGGLFPGRKVEPADAAGAHVLAVDLPRVRRVGPRKQGQAIGAATTPAAAAAALQAAGDQMLQAVIFHSDNLELSEQFDATTGYEKSLSNLSWSYASFLSAVRARTAI